MTEAADRGFGDALKSAREQTGLGIKDLAATTRIQARYLEALEAEDWDVVPHGVIGRGFVRIVSREVGVPADQLLALYREAREPVEDEPAPAAPPETDWKVDQRRNQRGRHALLGLVLLICAAVVIWIWSPWTVRSPETTEPGVPGTTERTAPPAAAEPAAVSGAVSEAVSADEPGEAPASAGGVPPSTAEDSVAPATEALGDRPPAEPTAAAGGPVAEIPTLLRLQVQAVEKSWVQVKADGGRPLARLFGPGERLTYEAREAFVVRLGNAGGVRFFWNGEALKVPGRPGQVMTLSFPQALETLRP